VGVGVGGMGGVSVSQGGWTGKGVDVEETSGVGVSQQQSTLTSTGDMSGQSGNTIVGKGLTISFFNSSNPLLANTTTMMPMMNNNITNRMPSIALLLFISVLRVQESSRSFMAQAKFFPNMRPTTL
jgi:hypothetical protein